MSELSIIKQPVKEELKAFNEFFQKELKSKVPLLNIILNYVHKQKGKQVRPLLVFLSAKLTGKVTQETYSAAFLIELMHTATLIHDDVVDVSFKRRGLFSIGALWRNKIAVLVGDYFLAKCLLHSVEKKTFKLMEIFSGTVKEMIEGELMQIEKARKLDIDEETYFKIIRKKTTSLITSAVVSGAHSNGSDEETIKKLEQLGDCIGVAFQIKDDLLDYEKSSITGKPAGNDLKEQKITLPLLHVIKKAPKKEKKWIYATVSKNNHDKKKIAQLVDYVVANGGLDYTAQVMKSYVDKAHEILLEFPESEARDSFSKLIDYIADRKK